MAELIRANKRHWFVRLVAVGLAGTMAFVSLDVPIATADNAPEPPQPSVGITPASWQWQETSARDGSPVRRHVPLREIELGRNGQSVWAANWWTNGADGQVALRISGLPDGVRVTPAGLPRHLEQDAVQKLSTCSQSGPGTFDCNLAGKPLPGARNSAVTLTADASAPIGTYRLSASVLANGEPLPDGSGNPADVNFSLTVTNTPTTTYFTGRQGEQLVNAKQPTLHKLFLYRLSGPVKGGGRLAVTNPVDRRLRTGVKVRGKVWTCSPSRCITNKVPAVGSSAKPIGLLWRITNKHVNRWPKISTAKAYQAAWWSRWQAVDGQRRTSGRFEQRSSLIRYAVPKQPKYRNAAQVLAPVKRAQVTTVVNRLGMARIGGFGRYSIQVSNGGSHKAKSVNLRLRPPAHAVVKKVTAGERWRCTKARCVWRGTLVPKRVLPPVTVVVKSRPKARASQRTQRFAAVASWRAPKQSGVKRDRGVEPADWLAPLRLTASSTNKVVHSESGIKTALTARVANVNGEQVSYTWTQVCTWDKGSCPKVTWVDKVQGTVTNESISARFLPPRVKKATKLQFMVTVRANGASRTAIATIMAKPAPTQAEKWNPRRSTTTPPTAAKVAAKLNNPSDPSTYQSLRPTPVAKARINKVGPTHVAVGSRAKLRVKPIKSVTGARGSIKKVVWLVDGRRVTKQTQRKKFKKLRLRTADNGRVLSFVVQKNSRAARVLTAQLVHPNGRRTVVQELVVPDRTKKGTRALLLDQPGDAGVPGGQGLTTRSSGQTFCNYFSSLSAGDSVNLTALTLTVGSVTVSGSACTDSGASITFTAPDVVVNGVTLSGITATMTSAQVSVAVASATLPSSSAGASTIMLSGSLTAAFSSSGLGSVSGTLNATGLSSLPYLSMPAGWSLSQGSVSLSSSGSFGLTLDATGPNQGQANVAGTIGGDSFSLTASVANAFTITGYDGSTAGFGGSGSLSYTAPAAGSSDSGTVAYNISLSLAGTSGTFQLLSNTSIGSASLSWGNTGMALAGSLNASIGSETVGFSLNATITDFSNWSATVSSTLTPSVGSLQMASLTGTLTGASGAVTFDIDASVELSAVSSFLDLTLTSASATLLNSCPASDTTCSTSQLRLDLAVAGSFTFFDDPIAINTSVDVNLATGAYDATFDLAGSNFGPAEAQLNSVMFFASDDGASDPNLANNPCYDSSSSGTTYGFTATATFMSTATFNIVGVYQGGSSSNPAGSGYCFSGALATSQVSGLSGLGLADSLNFIYSTYDTTAGGNTIPATSPTMWATMTLPSQVQTYLGGDVTGFSVMISVLTSGGSVNGLKLNGSVDMSAYIAGGPTSYPSFEITSLGVNLQVSSGSNSGVELSFDSDGVLTTEAGGDVTASTMNFDVTIGLDLTTGSGGGSLVLAANLIAGADAQMIDGVPVAMNAFGVNGLNIGQLGISVQIGFDALLNSSFTISATDVELPGNVASALGMSSNAPITFSLTVGITAPCFDIAIGTPGQSTTAALDWGGAGVLEAYYLHFLIAPVGNCVMSDGTAVTGNFAVAFDGYIFGDSVDINAEVEITPTFSADITATVGAFNVAGMDFQQTVIDIDFNPSAGVFDLNLSGGANLWGAVIVEVAATIDVNLSATDSSVIIDFNGSMDTNLFGIFKSDINVDIDVNAGTDNGTFYLNTLDISLSGDVQVLFITAEAEFTLDYSNGAVQTLSGSVGANVNLYVLDFFGEVAFSYDPAVTGNQNLSITLTGGVEVDLWIFSFTFSISITISVDASFLSSSEFRPQPTQQVTAPLNPVTSGSKSWSYQGLMFTGNNFNGLLEPTTENFQAVSNAANASTINSANDAFNTFWEPGFFNANWMTGGPSGLYESPATNASVGTNSWPGANTLNTNVFGNSISVQAVQGSGVLGQSTDTSSTYPTMEVTAYLPPSPLMSSMQAALGDELYRSAGTTPVPSGNPAGYYYPNYGSCSTGTTVTYTVEVPSVLNAAPGNSAWLIMDTNWRLFGASLRETAQLWTNWSAMPAIDDWFGWNDANSHLYNFFNNPLQQPLPLIENQLDNPDAVRNCGYEDFATQTSLLDFVNTTIRPDSVAEWNQILPTPFVDYFIDSSYENNPYKSPNGGGTLLPEWGDGWQPFNIQPGTQFGFGQTFNVWLSGDPGNPDENNNIVPQCTAQGGTPEETALWVPGAWGITQAWADASNYWVPIQGGNYLQLNASGNSSNPWSLALYNSLNKELRWNGSSWVTEPSGGWTSAYQPFSAAGQIYGADMNGVVYMSSQNHSTYLAFTAGNTLMQQYQAGSTTMSTTYTPDPSMNTCSSGAAIYTDPS